MKRRISWQLAIVLAAFVGLVVLLVRNLTAGPANRVRPSDVANAKADVPAPNGGDDRAPLAPDGYVSGNGVVEPADRETKLAGPVAGRIAALHVKEGDVVDAGAPLLELESDAEKSSLVAAEADLAVANAMLVRTLRGLRKEDVAAAVDEAQSAEARAKISAESLARDEKLAAAGAITAEELDKARHQADIDESAFHAADQRRLAAVNGARREDVLVAQAQVKAAEAQRDRMRIALDRLTIRAPIAGTILQIKYRVGEFYNPTSAAAAAEPLVVLGDVRTLRVRVDVDERDVAQVHLGAPAFVTLSAFPEKKFQARVVEVGLRMGRKNVRTDDPVERLDVKILEVVLQLDAPDALVPGIRVTAYVTKSDGA